MKKYVNFKCFYGIFWLFFVVALCASDRLPFLSEKYLFEKTKQLLKQPTFLDCLQEVCPDICYEPILSKETGRPEDFDKSINRAIIGARENFPGNIFSYDETIALLEESKTLPFAFPPQPDSLPVMSVPSLENAEIFYLSDMHGNGSVAPFLQFIHAKKDRVAIFGGDWFDRGLGIDNFLLALTYANYYKRIGTHKIFMIDADHEEEKFHDQKGTKEEIERRFPDVGQRNEFKKRFYELLGYFPVAGFMNGIFFSHALVHSDETGYDNGAAQRNFNNTGVIYCLLSPDRKLFKKDGNETTETFLKKNDAGISYEYFQLNPTDCTKEELVNTPLYVCPFSNKRWRTKEDFNNIVKPWFGKYDPDGSKIKVFLNGHDQPQEHIDKKFEDIEKYGCYVRSLVTGDFINPKSEIVERVSATCGVGGSNSYSVSRIYFPFKDNELCFGLSRQNAISYKNGKIRTVLLQEDKESEYFSIRQFWNLFEKFHLKDTKNFPTMESYVASCFVADKKGNLLDLLDGSFTTGIWQSFLDNNKNFLDQNEFNQIQQNPTEYLKGQKYGKNKSAAEVNTSFFVKHTHRIVWLIGQLEHGHQPMDVMNRLIVLKDQFNAEKEQNVKESKNRISLNSDFAENLKRFLHDSFYNSIDQIIANFKVQFDFKDSWFAQKESWNDFCLNTLGQSLPVSLLFTDGFATYSKKEQVNLMQLLFNKAFQSFVNHPEELRDEQAYFLNCLVSNVFASLNCCSEFEWLEWVSLEAKKRIVEQLVSFFYGNKYLSINSKIQVLSNIAFFYKSEEYGNFPVSFEDIKTMLEEQLIHLCDVGFACEKPIDDFSQIFTALAEDKRIELINQLLSVPIQNKKQQGDICMKSLFGPMYSKDLLVPINKVLPYLIDNFLDLDPETFEDFCIRGFRCTPESFLDFFDQFLLNDRLRIRLKLFLQLSFISKIFKDHNVKDALLEVEKNNNFERRKSEIVDIVLRMSRYNNDVLEFCVSHATTKEQLLRLAKLFYKDLSSFGLDQLDLKQLKGAYAELDLEQAAMNPGSSNGKKVLAMAGEIEKVEVSLEATYHKIAQLYRIFRKKNIGYLDIALTLYDQIWKEGTVESDKNMFKDYVKFLIFAGKKRRGEYRNNSFFGCVDSAGKLLSDVDILEIQKQINEINDVWLRDYVVLNLHLYPYVSKYFNKLLIDVKPENFVEFVNVVNTQALQVYYNVQQDSLIDLCRSNKDMLQKFIVSMLNIKATVSDAVLGELVCNDLISKEIDHNFLLNALEQAISCLQEQESIFDLLKKICLCFDKGYHQIISDFIQHHALNFVEGKDREIIVSHFHDSLVGDNSLFDALNAIKDFLAEKTSAERSVANAIVSKVLSTKSFDPLIHAQDKVAELALDIFLAKQQSVFSEKHIIGILLQALARCHNHNAGKKIMALLINRWSNKVHYLNYYNDVPDLLFNVLSKCPDLCPDELFPLASWSLRETVDKVFNDKDMFCFLCNLFFRNKIDHSRMIRLDMKLLQAIFSVDDCLKYIVSNTKLNAKDVSVFASVFVDEDFMQKVSFEVGLDFISRVTNMIISLDIEEIEKIFVPAKTIKEQNEGVLFDVGVKVGKNLWKLYDKIEKIVLDLPVNNENYIKFLDLLLQLPRAAIVLKRYANKDEYRQCIERVIGARKKIYPVVTDREKIISTILTKSRSFLSATTIPDGLNDLRHQFCFKIAHDFILDYGIAHDHSHLLLQEPVNPLLFFFNFAGRGEKLESYLNQCPASYIVDLLSKKARLNEQEKQLCIDYIKDNPLQKHPEIDYQKNIRKKLLLRGGIKLESDFVIEYKGDKKHSNEIIIEEIIDDNTGKKDSKIDSPKYGLVSHLSKTQVAVGLTSLIAIASIVWFKPYQAPLVQKIKSYFLWRLGFSQD